MNEEEVKKLINQYFISIENEDYCREVLKEALDKGIDFKLSADSENDVVTYKEQEKIKDDLVEPIPKEGSDLDKVLLEYNSKIQQGAVNFSSPHFIAFPDCGNAIASNVGHILMGLTNQNLINSIHTSPTATFAEIAVVNWLRELVGYEVSKSQSDALDIGGVAVTGGVSANTIGLLLARENLLNRTIKTGLKVPTDKIKVFIPQGIGHYSISAAAGWLGIGQDNVVEVRTTNEFTIDQDDLINKIEDYRSQGCQIMAIVAYTGDSRTMAIDDIEGIAAIAKKYGIWFHLDACHGLSLCFSEKMKEKVKGIELADSVTIDPHKVLFTPYTLSFLLVKDPRKFSLVSGVSDLITQEPFSFGQITPFFGSRSFESLKLWFLIKNLGKENIGKLIEYRHEMAKYLSELIDQQEDFYMMNTVTINSAVFIYVPNKLKQSLQSSNKKQAIQEINILNKRIQLRIFKEGKFYIHTFLLNDFKNVLQTGRETVFQMQRVMIGNPLTSRDVLKDFVSYISLVAKEEYTKMREENIYVQK